MKQFFGALLGSIVGLFLLLALLIGLAVGAASSSDEAAITLSDKTVVHIELSGTLNEQPDEVDQFLATVLDEAPALSLYELLEVIRRASESKGKVTVLWLELGGIDASWAALTELRTALAEAQKSGLKVVATSKGYDPKSYYLASVAKKIYLAPAGSVILNGLSASPLYFKGALDKLGVKAHLVRGSDNAFKSAGEPFIADRMSEANKMQYTQLLGELWSEIETSVRASRTAVNDSMWTQVLNKEPLVTAERALALGLVDAL
jgi:protease-4